MTRTPTRRTATLAAAALLLAVATGTGTLTAGAAFTTQATSPDTATVETATLESITGLAATRDETDQAAVSWTTPASRPDVTPAYTIERSIDGATSSIVPTITDTAGTTSFTDDLTVPATIEGKTVTAISAGNWHSCAIADGAAYCWGYGADGRLGTGSAANSRVPVAVDTSGVLAGKTVTSISIGIIHSCAVADGAAFCWGNSQYGQLGDASADNSLVPVAVDTSGVLAGKTVTSISAGNLHSCVVADGAAFCWGLGGSGQLGYGSAASSLVPVAVDTSGVLAGKTVTSISAGIAHSCAVADGAGYCWGDGDSGRLGNSSTTSARVPVAVDASGVLGNRICAADWTHAGGDRCAPGAAIPVSYTIDYTKAGWSSPAPAGVTATWEGTP